MTLEPDDREPLSGDVEFHGSDAKLQSFVEPRDTLFDEDLSPVQHLRLLLRMLHQAITVQLESSELEPSPELDVAMSNARTELDWWGP